MGSPTSAEAFCACKSGMYSTANSAVWMLYQHANGMENVLGGDLTVIEDVEKAIKSAIEVWNTEGQSNKRFFYAGRTSIDFYNNSSVQNAVLVRATTSQNECGDNADGCMSFQGSSCSGTPANCTVGRILVQRTSYLLNGDTWSLNPTTGKRDLTGLLVHELGHALGLDDMGRCGQHPVSVMNSSFGRYTAGAQYLRRDDIEGAVFCQYWRNWQLKHQQSSSGASWAPGSTGMPSIVPDTRFGSISTDHQNNLGRLYVAYPFSHAANLQVYDTQTGWSGRSIIDNSEYGRTYNPVSVAAATDAPGRYLLVAFLANEQTTNMWKDIRFAVSYNGGLSWGFNEYLKHADGRRVQTDANGVTVAYDPGSHRWVILYASSDKILGSHTVTWNGSQTPGFGAIIGGRDVPAIACRHPDVADNCMLLEYSTTGCRRTLRGHVYAGGQFMLNTQAEIDCSDPSQLAHETPALTGAHYDYYPWVRARPSRPGLEYEIRVDTSKHYWDPATPGWGNSPTSFPALQYHAISEPALGYVNSVYYAFYLEKYALD
ncbi:MAG: hypothetical protein IT371_15630 [Deltaproteobacteria bacterium]|nr:hypothetical protein [Deltaproteobacteria bacterium]